MSRHRTSEQTKPPGRLSIISLALAAFAERNLDVIVGLLLLDIALTFQIAVGVASQFVMISKIAAVATGLLMGVLSVRFRHKLLLLIGSSLIIVGSLGCFLAPSFDLMRLFYPLDGVGSVIVIAMALALIGECLPLEKRAKAVSYVVAGGALAFVIGGPAFSAITGIGGWRAVFGWYILPVSVASFLLVFLFAPSTPTSEKKQVNKRAYVNSFKQVLLTKSAFFCLVGTLLFLGHRTWSVFAMTFYRTRFSVPLNQIGLILTAVTLCVVLGSIVGGRLVNKYGRKRLVVLTNVARGAILVAMVYIPVFWVVLGIDLFHTFFGAITSTAQDSLNLEQAPVSRGTMMSIASVFGSLGMALGTALGGPILDQLGFQALGLTFASMGIAAGLIVHFLAKDPSTAKVQTHSH